MNPYPKIWLESSTPNLMRSSNAASPREEDVTWQNQTKSAFWIVPVAKQDWPLLGSKYLGKYFVDTCLPFGLTTSCAIFEAVEHALQALVDARLTTQEMRHYLDDFIGCDVTHLGVNVSLEELFQICEEVGIPIAWDKTVWGATCLRFLGLDVDTVEQVIRIPHHKVTQLLRKLDFVLSQKTVRVKVFHSLAGSMNFYAKAKPGGWTFIRRVYDAEAGLPMHYHINVTSELKKDLKMWVHLLKCPEHATPFCDTVKTLAEDLDFFTDASGDEDLGWGIYLRGQWAQGCWGRKFIRECAPSTAFLELYPVTLAALRWGLYFMGKWVLLNCDNTGTVMIINQQTSKSPQCMALLQHLILAQMKWLFVIVAQYIKSEDNTIVADALSCFQDLRFRRMAPDADWEPIILPECLLPLSKDTWNSCLF